MTIKELEQKTGMTRANIRFYESEGLLSPRRLANGYRDYSEEDARTLEKIKLLRQLQLDLDTIRRVQQGTLTLEQALFVQLTRLEGDRAVAQRAAEVCRALERSGVEYGALEPEQWLRQLEAPVQPRLPEPPPPEAAPWSEPDRTPQACYHPWRRLFARTLDVMLYRTAFELVWMAIVWNRDILRPPLWLNWVLDTLALLFALAVEPLWLHFAGWTPGKWVFGLKLRQGNGETLTLAWAYQRSIDLLRRGYGWNIPIYRLWRLWKCRKLSLEGIDCAWDDWENRRYTWAPQRFRGPVIYLLAAAACTGLVVLMGLRTYLPACRGDLTVAEVARNYNCYRGQMYEWRVMDLPKVDRQGNWRAQPSVTMTYPKVSYYGPDGEERVIENAIMDTTVWAQPEYTEEHGRVTAVTLRLSSRDSLLWLDGRRETLFLLAMSGAADGLGLFNFDLPGWWKVLEEQPIWSDWELEYRGLRISQRVDYTGYQVEYTGYRGARARLACDDWSTPHHYEKTLTISLIE